MTIDAIKYLETPLAVINTGTVSSALILQPWTRAIGVFIPDIDAGAVGLECSMDGGTTFVPVQDLWLQDDCVIIASGKDPCYVDFSPFIQSIQRGNSECKIRFTCAAQSAVRTLTVVEVG